MINKTVSVRFYIRPRGRMVGEKTTPLRIKAWNGSAKKWLYITTDLRVQRQQFRSVMATDGTPTHYASPAFAKDVERYRDAILLVMSSAVVNGKILTITSDYLNRRVNGIVARMRANAESGVNQPIVVGASPMDKEARKVCVGCKFYGAVCTAPWHYSFEADTAAEFAAYNGLCFMRQERQDGEEGGEA